MKAHAEDVGLVTSTNPVIDEQAVEQVETILLPVPDTARTLTAGHQFWIWSGANIARINWVLGSLGIDIGLSLFQTVLVLVIGNIIGMAAFGFFVLMGQRSGVSQMVMARSAFGRRGAYLPAVNQGLISAGWCAVSRSTRKATRQLVGRIKLEPDENGGLWASFRLQPAALLRARGNSGRGERI